MKRTTYILIGLIVSGLIVIIASIIFISTSEKPYPENGLFVGGELVEMNMDGIHVVKMFVSQSEDSKERRIYMNGDVKMSSPSAAGERKIVYPKNDYMYATGIDVQMSVDSLNSLFINTQGLRLNLKEVKMDSLFVHAIYQKVLLDSCQFRSFSIDGEELRFTAKDSKMENFYLNLNSAWDWGIENCDIDTEYLRGSGTHRNALQVGECKRVMWIPTGKDAQLQLYLQEKAEIIVNP